MNKNESLIMEILEESAKHFKCLLRKQEVNNQEMLSLFTSIGALPGIAEDTEILSKFLSDIKEERKNTNKHNCLWCNKMFVGDI